MHSNQSIVGFYGEVPQLSEELIQVKMEDEGWEIDIDRPGEGEHEIRFRRVGDTRVKGRGVASSRAEALRVAAQSAIRSDLGPNRCFQLGLM